MEKATQAFLERFNRTGERMTTPPKFKGPGITGEMLAELSDELNGPSPWHFRWWGPGSAIFIVGDTRIRIR